MLVGGWVGVLEAFSENRVCGEADVAEMFENLVVVFVGKGFVRCTLPLNRAEVDLEQRSFASGQRGIRRRGAGRA